MRYNVKLVAAILIACLAVVSSLATAEVNTISQSNNAVAMGDAQGSAAAISGVANSPNVDQIGLLNTVCLDQDPNSMAEATSQIGEISAPQDQKNCVAVFGEGNSVTQSNDANANIQALAEASASSFAANTANLEQDACLGLNLADVKQEADSSASADAIIGALTITQNQANTGIQVGNYNTLTQSNAADAKIVAIAEASASASASNDARIDQLAKNQLLGLIPAINLASVDQWADTNVIAEAIINPITINQDQHNKALQVGDNNELDQENNANANLLATASSSATSQATASNTALIDQDAIAKLKLNGGAYNTLHLDQDAIAFATSMSVIGDLNEIQSQTNGGIEVGTDNDMSQANLANANRDVDKSASALAGAGTGALITQYANPGSHDVTLYFPSYDESRVYSDSGPLTITQDQKNLGFLVGTQETFETPEIQIDPLPSFPTGEVVFPTIEVPECDDC